jgi:hypothetical protein
MIENYFNNIEENLNNNINDYKNINKDDYELSVKKITNKWEQISKNKNSNNNNPINLSEKNYEVDSLNNSVEYKTLSNGSISKNKKNHSKSRLSVGTSFSKYSASDDEENEIYYIESEGDESLDIIENVNKNLKECDEYIEYNKKRIYKPFIEKPANGDDHNIYIYYPNYG